MTMYDFISYFALCLYVFTFSYLDCDMLYDLLLKMYSDGMTMYDFYYFLLGLFRFLTLGYLE